MNVKRMAVAGLLASMVMGMVQMMYEAVAGAGFWSPVVFISATLLRDLQTVATPVPFLFMPVILGLMGHMMNSVILGGIFATIVRGRLQGPTTLAIGGVVFGLMVFALMWLVVLPLADPAMLRVNGLVFGMAHMMWGGALGLILGWGEVPVGVTREAHAH